MAQWAESPNACSLCEWICTVPRCCTGFLWMLWFSFIAQRQANWHLQIAFGLDECPEIDWYPVQMYVCLVLHVPGIYDPGALIILSRINT